MDEFQVERIIRGFFIGLLLISLSANLYLLVRVKKAETCNKAFVLWFKHNLGIHINLDKLYEDAVKWVNDPQYQ